MSEFQICPRQSGKTTTMKIVKRSYEEQRRLREHYLREKGINYDTPGSRNHA